MSLLVKLREFELFIANIFNVFFQVNLSLSYVILQCCLVGRLLYFAPNINSIPGDKLASVLRPSQLLEMKVGEAEAAWAKQGQKELFILVKELILQCILVDRDTRITAAEALNHPVFLQHPSHPTITDLYLLQSPLHQLSHFSNTETKEENKICEEMLRDLRVECEDYGEISDCTVTDGGHAFVTFQEVGLFIQRLITYYTPLCIKEPKV